MRPPPTPTTSDRPRRRSRWAAVLEVCVRVATLAFWLPILAYDIHALMLAGWTAESLGTVFWLLYRQALVFLALWAAMAGVQALLLVRSGPPPGRAPKRAALDADSAVMRFR